VPPNFAVASPARIAFDFPNTASGVGRGAQNISEGDLRSVNVVQAGDRTRLVLNLSRSLAYDTQIEGNTLLITLQGATTAAGARAERTTHFAEPRAGDRQHAVRNIDFRRGASGEGRVVVDLSDALVFVVAIPNLLGLYLMAPLIKKELTDYESTLR